MTTFNWKILEVSAKNELITHAKYHVTAIDEDENKVETEGNWWFEGKEMVKPFLEVTESDVAEWIEKETTQFGENIIKSRLEEQLASLRGNRVVVAPWLPQIFTPNL
jgi:hypothetical protein